MGTISLSLPSDGNTIDAADVNTPLNTISAVINGNLDDDNVKVGANINGTKLLINSIPPTAGDANMRGGWNAGIVTAMPTVTALGNRSYSLVHATTDLTGYLSPGMRLKLTRTVAAPTQCTSLNGTTQYYSKAAPAGMTFTDDCTLSAWVKMTSYGTTSAIAGRYDGTSGFVLQINTTGQVQLLGLNAGAANFKGVQSYQSIPLNKWVHVAAELDMNTATLTPTTNYMMIDGVDVPASIVSGGTAPTTLIQAGNLMIGATNSTTPASFFPGKIAQVAIYNAHVTQATILASMHQTLSGSETSEISAYSFNNTINDLNANANNLTANGSAVATNADSPFAQGATAGSLEYGIITAIAFSTNTTLTVQVPEGSAIPTTGGVSAVSYSTQQTPYGFPKDKNKWRLASILKTAGATTSNATYGAYLSAGYQLIVPIGVWDIGQLAGNVNNASTTEVNFNISSTALTGLTKTTGSAASPFAIGIQSSAAAFTTASYNISRPSTIAAQSTYIMYTIGATTQATIQGDTGPAEIFAEFSYL